jgi:two-component system sensor histidine kinase/response regulator
MHKPDRYLALLHKFLESQQNLVGTLTQALDTQDREAAIRITHTVKGVSGNVGAVRVQAAAEALELAVREGQEQAALHARLADLSTALHPLLEGLRSRLPAIPSPPSHNGTVEPIRLRNVAGQLRRLLMEMDAEALDLAQREAGLLSAALGKHFQAWDAALKGCDFDAALQHLDLATATKGETT